MFLGMLSIFIDPLPYVVLSVYFRFLGQNCKDMERIQEKWVSWFMPIDFVCYHMKANVPWNLAIVLKKRKQKASRDTFFYGNFQLAKSLRKRWQTFLTQAVVVFSVVWTWWRTIRVSLLWVHVNWTVQYLLNKSFLTLTVCVQTLRVSFVFERWI